MGVGVGGDGDGGRWGVDGEDGGGVRVGVGAEEEEVVVSAVVRAVEDVVAEERVMRGMRARGIGEGVEGMYGVGAEAWEVLG